MMAASVKYITYEYKTLLHNAAIVLSIVMLAVIGVNSFLAFMFPCFAAFMYHLTASSSS